MYIKPHINPYDFNPSSNTQTYTEFKFMEAKPKPKYRSGKRFGPITTTHRNYHAATNKERNSVKCSWVHGYGRNIDLTFETTELTNEGWVFDFGNCKWFKEWFDENFDHKTLISSSDPELKALKKLEKKGVIKLTVIPDENGWNPSIEGSCKWVYDVFNSYLKNNYPNVSIVNVKIYEHEYNWAEYGIY